MEFNISFNLENKKNKKKQIKWLTLFYYQQFRIEITFLSYVCFVLLFLLLILLKPNSIGILIG